MGKKFVEERRLNNCFNNDIKRAYNGDDALKLIRRMSINVIISDVFMNPNCSNGYAPNKSKNPLVVFIWHWRLKSYGTRW